jgi:hypothetical protein
MEKESLVNNHIVIRNIDYDIEHLNSQPIFKKVLDHNRFTAWV